MAICSKWICSPDNCNAPDWYDEEGSAPHQEEEVKIDSSTNLASPTAPYILVGSVTFEITFKLDAPISSKVSSVSLSPSIVLTNNQIPGSVTAKAIEWMNDNCESWLNGVSDVDGLLEYFAQAGSIQDHQDALDFSMGWRDPQYLPGGTKYGQNIRVRTVTLDYYTTGKFEGCASGTSPSYGEDDYKCGYGKFTIDNNLHYARPNLMPAHNLTFNAIKNSLSSGGENDFKTVIEPGVESLATAANNYMNGTYPCYNEFNCWAYVAAQASISNQNGAAAAGNQSYLFGGGNVQFGGNINFADPNFPNQALSASISNTSYDWAIFNGQDNPYSQSYKGTSWSLTLNASLGTIVNQAPYIPAAVTQQVNIIKSAIATVFGNNQAHASTIIQTVVQIVDENNNKGEDPGKAQPTATLQGEGATMNVITDQATTGSGSWCWLARAAYGQDSAEWRKFRKYLQTSAPIWLTELYNDYAPRIAKNIRDSKTGILKNVIKAWMNTKIRNISL